MAVTCFQDLRSEELEGVIGSKAAGLRASGWSDVRNLPLSVGGRRGILISAEAA